MPRFALLAYMIAWTPLVAGCDGKHGESDADDVDLQETEDQGDMDVLDPTDPDVPTDEVGDPAEDEEESVDPGAWYCTACTWDSECGPGGECLPLEGGEMSCGTVCAGEADCESGASCEERADGVTRCVPGTGTCVWDTIGTPCPSWGCTGRESMCSTSSGDDGYCTHACAGPEDCAAGYNRCADRGDGISVCMPDLPSPFEMCGITEHADGVGSPCSSPTCADPIFVCSSSLSADIPPFCTHECEADADCGEAGSCVVLEGGDGSTSHCVPDECSCLGVVPGSMLDEALAATNLTRCDLGWPEAVVSPTEPTFRYDRFRLPWFADVHNDWLRGGVPLATDLEESLDASADDGPAAMIEAAAFRTGHAIAGGIPSFTPDGSRPLASAMEAVITAAGGTPDAGALDSDASDVPAEVQVAVAILLLASAEAIFARSSAVAGTIGDDEFTMRLFFMKTPGFVLPMYGTGLDPTQRQVQDLLIGDFGYEEVYQAAYGIASAVEQADLPSVTVSPGAEFSFDQATPAGRVIISGPGDDLYDGSLSAEDVLLLLDTGGNDTYRMSAGANTSIANPVSLCVDLGGSDLYGYVEDPDPRDGTRLVSDDGGRAASPNAPFSLSDHARQGAGRMGIGMLIDLGGADDTYASLRMSQGFGSLGVGLLWDDGGSESYGCESGCQGAGIFGLGLLVDRGPGTDSYSSYNSSQGFGYTGAVGILHDGGGPDSYLCNQDDVLYPSAQDSLSNFSACQGMGFGRRADIEYGGDGVFMSGGLGVLRDQDGNDTYEAGIFAEGAGYWFALGALLDGGGDDVYAGRWYVLGAGAHYANGLLHDAGGNDRYNEFEDRRLNVTLGGGHDYSIAFLIDDSGDDTYYSPNLSLGAGNDNGFGLLLDRDGIDSYECSSNFSLGNAITSPYRSSPLSVGIFLDAGGVDGYTRPDTSLLVEGTVWTQTMTGAPNEHGAGFDSPAGVPGI